MTDEPFKIRRALRPNVDVGLEWAAAWRTAVPGLVVQWQLGAWTVTHEPTGYRVSIGKFAGGVCCRQHADEWVDKVAEADIDWTAITVERMQTDPELRARTYEAAEAAGDTWQCGHYQPVITVEEAAAIVDLELGDGPHDTADVIQAAIDTGVARLADTGGPQVGC